VLPVVSPRNAPKPSWTVNLVRGATPFFAVAAVFAIQVAAGAGPVLAFPLYLTVILLTALQLSRLESLATAVLAAIGILIPSVMGAGRPADLAPALLLAVVLLVAAVAVTVVVRQGRAAADLARREAGATADLARRQAEEIAASEERLRLMLEAAMVGLALIDGEGRWVTVNDRLGTILGRPRDELLQLPLEEVTAEKDRPVLSEALALLRSGDIVRWEAELNQIRGDGTRVPVAIAIGAAPGHTAGASLLLVQESDISVRKRLDGLRDCLVAVRHVIVSGLSWEQAVPQILSSLCAYLDQDLAQYWAADSERQALRVRHYWHRDASSFEAFREKSRAAAVPIGASLLGRVWQSGVVAAVEDLAEANDYASVEVARAAGLRSVIAFPVVDAGVVIGVVELLAEHARSVQDDEVTMLSTIGLETGQFIRRSDTAQALRRSEADHRAIFERSPIGIVRISGDGELLEANPALLIMLEHDLDAMRNAWPDLLRAYDQAAARHRLPPLLAGIAAGGSVQVRTATGSAKWLWLQLTATSIPDSNGRPEHLLLMVEDVTTVRETSDQLAEALESQRSANANLEKLDRTKTEFLSIVSHEFRTALTGIQGFSELIRDGGLEADEVRAYGGYIFNDADRINRLIGDMLDLDRMESGRMSMRTGDVDINEVLTEAMARAGTAAGSPVEFKADLDPRLPIVVGDRDRLIQVVSNLVNNAVKYSPDGGTVTLSTRSEGGFALVSVADTGLGIPQDEIGHVFERFRRVRSGAAQSIPGTGLGLTIVKQIVEMHGGKIWVESAVGHGSAFHFTVPLVADNVTLQRRHA